MRLPRPSGPCLRENWAAGLTTISVAVLLVSSVLIEWSFPYCSNPEDGPLYALFGSPLPYMTFSGASSMHFRFAPHLYLVDVTLVALMLAPLISAVFRRLPRLVGRVLGVVSALTLLAAVGWGALLAHVKFLNPTIDISSPPWISYTEIRPVAIAFGVHYDCKPLP